MINDPIIFKHNKMGELIGEMSAEHGGDNSDKNGNNSDKHGEHGAQQVKDSCYKMPKHIYHFTTR
jgi:hypothetical protein